MERPLAVLVIVAVLAGTRLSPPPGCSLDGRTDRVIWKQAVAQGDRRLVRAVCRPGPIGWPWNLPGAGPQG
jgi:hypothetical protein